MSLLDISIQLTVSDILIVVVLAMIVSQVPHVFFWLERRKWNPEGDIFISARKKGYPIIEKCAMNGFTEFILGEKETKGDPVFKVDRTTHQGVHLDPRLSSGGVPKEHIRGAELMHYSTAISISMSSRTAMAYSTIIKYVRKNYDALNVLPDDAIIELVYRNRADLAHDCRNFIEIYDFENKILIPQPVLDAFHSDIIEQLKNEIMENGEEREPSKDEIEIRYQQNLKGFQKMYQAKTLAEIFKKIQDELVVLPVETEKFFSFAEAFQRTPLATFASDLQSYMGIIELISQLKASASQEKYRLILICGIVIVGIIIAGAVAMNIIPAHAAAGK